MAQVTRRRFLATSAVGAAAVGSASGLTRLLAQTQSGCTIVSNFNGTQISEGDFIWFNSVVKVRGLSTDQPVTIVFAPNPITFSANGSPFSVPLPTALITFTPSLALATTDFVPGGPGDPGQWLTNVPSSGLSGNVFLDGVAFHVPNGGLPGGIKGVTWSGMFSSCTPGISVQWQWAAAVYRFAGFLDQGADGLGVKPVDDNHASAYKNSDHAGTPENFRHYVVGGARGGGGSNFTGSYSGTASCDAQGSLTGCGGS